MNKHLTEQITQKNTSQSFEGLPIEDLITAPIIAAAKGQQELTSVYIDNLLRLAYSDEADKETNKKKTLLSQTTESIPKKELSE